MKRDYFKPSVGFFMIFIESAIANTSNINVQSVIQIEQESFEDDGDSGNFLEW